MSFASYLAASDSKKKQLKVITFFQQHGTTVKVVVPLALSTVWNFF